MAVERLSLLDNSVDLVMASPSYWKKRDYGYDDYIVPNSAGVGRVCTATRRGNDVGGLIGVSILLYATLITRQFGARGWTNRRWSQN